MCDRRGQHLNKVKWWRSIDLGRQTMLRTNPMLSILRESFIITQNLYLSRESHVGFVSPLGYPPSLQMLVDWMQKRIGYSIYLSHQRIFHVVRRRGPKRCERCVDSRQAWVRISLNWGGGWRENIDIRSEDPS
ncbi:hypothetical protein WAI453_004436 [Rhynchosporium graminicola]